MAGIRNELKTLTHKQSHNMYNNKSNTLNLWLNSYSGNHIYVLDNTVIIFHTEYTIETVNL